MLAPIIEEQSFRAPFAFIIAGPQTDRVDVAPIVLFLWVNRRIAINFRGRCLQDLGLHALGEAQHVDRSVHADLRGLHRVELIMHGRRRAGEIENFVDFDIERKTDVVAHQLEQRVREQMLHVASSSGVEIIDTQDFVAALQQPFAQV